MRLSSSSAVRSRGGVEKSYTTRESDSLRNHQTIRVVQSQPSRDEGERAVMAQAAEKSFQKANYGLRREILSPMGTLAQSVSTMAPTTTPAATIPPVCALAGNGTWLAYVLRQRPCCMSRYASPAMPAIRRRGRLSGHSSP